MVCVLIYAFKRLQSRRHKRLAVSLSENKRFIRLKSYSSLFSNRISGVRLKGRFRSSFSIVCIRCRMVRCGASASRIGNHFFDTLRPRSPFLFWSSSSYFKTYGPVAFVRVLFNRTVCTAFTWFSGHCVSHPYASIFDIVPLEPGLFVTTPNNDRNDIHCLRRTVP